MRRRTERLFRILTVAFCGAYVGLFLLAALYSRPCVDDFSFGQAAHTALQNGGGLPGVLRAAVQNVVWYYQNWQGTYASIFIMSLQPGIFSERLYFLGAWTVLLLEYGCIHFAVSTGNKGLGLHISPDAAAVCILAAVQAGLPAIDQGLYWFNGTWHYMPFFFLMLLNGALCVRYLGERRKRWLVLAAMTSVIVSGGNFVTAFANILVLVLLTVYRWKKGGKGLLAVLLPAAVGCAVSFLAPGNAVRQAGYVRQPVVKTMIMSLVGLYQYGCRYMQLQWLLCMAVAAYAGTVLAKRYKGELRLHPAIPMLAGCAVLCAELCIPYMSMVSFGPGRVQNVYWLTFLFASCGCCSYGTAWLWRRKQWEAPGGLGCALLVAALVICLHWDGNGMLIVREYAQGKLQTFAAQNDDRLAQAKNAEPGSCIHVEPLVDSEVLRYDDVTEDIHNWRNGIWEGYYGVGILADME